MVQQSSQYGYWVGGIYWYQTYDSSFSLLFQRLLSSLYSDQTENVYEEGCLLSPPKQPRMLLLPGEDSSSEVYSTTALPAVTRVAGAGTTVHRSRRLLENAG